MDETHQKPINKTAALVVSSGFHYVSDKKILSLESRNPIAIRKPNRAELGQKSFVDLTGRRYARFTVIGQYSNGAGWVVRCDCGMYCIRQAKAIKNPKNDCDRCEECRHLRYLKRKDYFRRTGKDGYDIE